MLDFFGLELKNEATGQLQRASQWHDRMTHLNRFICMFLVAAGNADCW